MDLTAQLALSLNNKVFANPRRIALLRQIVITGSLNQGAKMAGISYKAAWDAVNEMNAALEQPVVSSEKGGRGGGGAKLTPFGERLLKVYSLTEQVQGMALTALLDDSIAMNSLLDLMAYFSLHTSARNQLYGIIQAIEPVDINDMVSLELASGQQVKVSVTHTSTKQLALSVGKSVLILFKAPAVTLKVKQAITTRVDTGNYLAGELICINSLGHKTELTLDIGAGDKVYSVMDEDKTNDMQQGKQYIACFDAAQTIIACMN